MTQTRAILAKNAVEGAVRDLQRRARADHRLRCPLTPRSAEERRRAPSMLDITLDPAQRGVVTLPAGRATLVLGEAGHGKTTVALHRLAHLARAASSRFRAVVIVPTEGLRRLVVPWMRRLGIDAEITTYDLWARQQARRAFVDAPRRESVTTRANVIRLKRDRAVRTGLEALAERAPGRVDDDYDRVERRPRARARRGDLQHLFGDRPLLERIARASAGRLSPFDVEAMLEHTRVQFEPTGEEEYAHVDADRLVTVDGRTLDAGTAAEDAGSIDVEDYAILFELDRLRAEAAGGRGARRRLYDCIVLDEAQEVAPFELALIGHSLRPDGTLIVAGDADQQVDPSVTFERWETTMADLQRPDHERVVLEIGYRCSPAVVSMARSFLSGVSGSPIAYRRFDGALERAAWIIDAARWLARRDPRSSLAIVLRTPRAARDVGDLVRLGARARVVLDGRFVFGAGLVVTSVDQVKGLEFDRVIVADADAATYPDTAASRRALYVGVTRARHEAFLAGVGPPSAILSEERVHDDDRRPAPERHMRQG